MPTVENTANEENNPNIGNEENPKPEAEAAPAPADSAQGKSFAISESEWAELKAALDKRYAEIANLLRYNKTKEEAIQKLSKEIEKYRDDFAYSSLKPFITALISLREDCRKSIRDAEKYKDDPAKAVDDAKAKKFLGFLVSDIEEMVSNLGLEHNEGKITINGKPLLPDANSKKTPVEIPSSDQEQHNREYAEIVMCTDEIKNTNELIEYLKKNENAIRVAVTDRAVVDKTITEYIAFAGKIDAGYYSALTAPVASEIFLFSDSISNLVKASEKYSGEQLVKIFIKINKKAKEDIGEILTIAGVQFEKINKGGEFDGQKHKVLKLIPTEDKNLDRTIANTYSDCYIFDEKIIYQSKVDVYKFTPAPAVASASADGASN